MPDLRTYKIFVSHAWRPNADNVRLIRLLDDSSLFKYHNSGSFDHDPLVNPDTAVGSVRLGERLIQQIKPSDCVVIIADLYLQHSAWIHAEIKLAQSYGKPIIGVIPWGLQPTPAAVQSVAKEMVAWSTRPLVAVIKKWSLPEKVLEGETSTQGAVPSQLVR